MTQLARAAVVLVRALADDRTASMAHVVDVFRGARNAALLRRGHDRMPAYGAGQELRRVRLRELRCVGFVAHGDSQLAGRVRLACSGTCALCWHTRACTCMSVLAHLCVAFAKRTLPPASSQQK